MPHGPVLNSPAVSSRCPLTGDAGRLVSTRSRNDLISSYQSFFGVELPTEMTDKYFPPVVHHWRSSGSGLEWYSPARMGQGDFYELLGRLPWYYAAEYWDKNEALEILSRISPGSVLEVGCGTGAFLERMVARGIQVAGVDINRSAIAEGIRRRRNVYHSDDPGWRALAPESIVMLQCLEHVESPLSFLEPYLELPSLRRMIISVPCSESLLSRSTDPLNWPPHHATFWNLRALNTLAKLVGMHLTTWVYEPNSWTRFSQMVAAEPRQRLQRLPKWQHGKLGI